MCIWKNKGTLGAILLCQAVSSASRKMQERDQKEEEEKKKERVNQMQNSISWWEETIAAERQSAMHQRDLQFSGQPQMYKQSILHP